MIKKIVVFFFTSIIIFSCIKKQDVKEIKVNDKYILTVPDYLISCNDLNQQASLQLQSLDSDLYLVVIDEEKPKTHICLYTLDSYFKTVTKQPFIKEIKYPIINDYPEEIKLSGNKALISSIKGLVNDRFVYYKLAIIETPKRFYQIILWTREENSKKLDEDILNIIHSFKEIK